MTGEPTPFLQVDLGEENGTRVFHSKEEVKRWIEAEKKSWNWLLGLGRQVSNTVQTYFDNVTGYVNAISEEPTPNEVSKLQGRIESAFQGEGLPTTESPTGRFLKELGEREPAVGAGATSFFLPKVTNLEVSDKGFFEGAQLAVLYERGMYETAESERASLQALRNRWEQTLIQQDARFRQSADRGDILTNSSDEAEVARVKTFDRFLEEAVGKKDAFLKKGIKDLEAIASTYDERLSLQAPVKYWTDKSTYHGRWSKVFAALTVVAAGGVVTGLVYAFNAFLGDATTYSPAEFWEIGIVGALAVIGVWSLRILVRVMLSHLHLQADADARAVMVEVFLSLIRSESALADSDRHLILNALFKPISTGIVKDDAVPTSLLDVVTRSS